MLPVGDFFKTTREEFRQRKSRRGQRIWRNQCSKRTAQLAITHAVQQGEIRQHAGQYVLPLPRKDEC